MPDILQLLESEIPGITVTELPTPPPELVEPNDMQVVIPPCNGYEPSRSSTPRGSVPLPGCGDRYAA